MKGIDERVRERFIARQKYLFGDTAFGVSSSDNNNPEHSPDIQVKKNNKLYVDKEIAKLKFLI